MNHAPSLVIGRHNFCAMMGFFDDMRVRTQRDAQESTGVTTSASVEIERLITWLGACHRPVTRWVFHVRNSLGMIQLAGALLPLRRLSLFFKPVFPWRVETGVANGLFLIVAPPSGLDAPTLDRRAFPAPLSIGIVLVPLAICLYLDFVGCLWQSMLRILRVTMQRPFLLYALCKFPVALF
jgi:hypothetical protein